MKWRKVMMNHNPRIANAMSAFVFTQSTLEQAIWGGVWVDTSSCRSEEAPTGTKTNSSPMRCGFACVNSDDSSRNPKQGGKGVVI